MTLKDLHSTFKLLDGNKIPCLGFGTYKIDKGQAGIDTLLHAIELGYRHCTQKFQKVSRKVQVLSEKITRRRFMCDRASLEKLTKMSEMLNSQAERLEGDLKALDSEIEADVLKNLGDQAKHLASDFQDLINHIDEEMVSPKEKQDN